MITDPNMLIRLALACIAIAFLAWFGFNLWIAIARNRRLTRMAAAIKQPRR